jgi:hypothetical protein
VGNGNLSADLTTSMLSPASSVFPDEGQSSHPESEGKSRRRGRRESEPEAETETETDDSLALDAAESSPHQLDQLA